MTERLPTAATKFSFRSAKVMLPSLSDSRPDQRAATLGDHDATMLLTEPAGAAAFKPGLPLCAQAHGRSCSLKNFHNSIAFLKPPSGMGAGLFDLLASSF